MSGLFDFLQARSVPDAAAVADGPASEPPAGTARRRLTAATIPEQVAKHGQAILNGQYAPGEQIKEQAIAELFGISRGPVRDALRVLQAQGTVEISPRRGAFVVELQLNDVIDIFNIRSALLSLAVRYGHQSGQGGAGAAARAAGGTEGSGKRDEPALIEFVRAIGRMGVGLMHACGNRQLIQAYRTLPHDGIWQMLWVTTRPMDYMTRARRRRACATTTGAGGHRGRRRRPCRAHHAQDHAGFPQRGDPADEPSPRRSHRGLPPADDLRAEGLARARPRGRSGARRRAGRQLPVAVLARCHAGPFLERAVEGARLRVAEAQRHRCSGRSERSSRPMAASRRRSSLMLW